MNVEAATQPKTATTTKAKLRSTWNLKTPEYLIILVIASIIWVIGFIELLNHTSTKAVVFGLYSWLFFIILLAHGSGLLLLGGLMARPHHSGWFVRSVAYIQDRWWLAGFILVLLMGISWLFLSFKPLERFPGLQVSVVTMCLLIALVLIFAGWGKQERVHTWRKVVAVPIAAIVGLEVLFQGLAILGLVPAQQTVANLYVPYSRIYQDIEGLGNGVTNGNGWYAPDFQLKEDSRKLFLLGDTYLQGLQVKPEETLGAVLQTSLDDASAEVARTRTVAMGYPGFGPGLYADVPLLEHYEPYVEPDEIIVFFNLAHDFQTVSGPSEHHLFFVVDEQGQVDLHPDNWDVRHNLQHYALEGFDPINVLDTLSSHYLTPKLLKNLFAGPAAQAEVITASDADNDLGFRGLQTYVIFEQVKRGDHLRVIEAGHMPGPANNNFLFETEATEKAEKAMRIAAAQLDSLHDYVAAKGIDLHVVSIPVFPAAFYDTYQDDSWDSTIKTYDLFLPEERLAAYAAERGISFLPMGQYMQNDNLTVEQIKELYYADGQGHFTPEGHKYFADAVYRCFFAAEEASADCPN